jgi:hypothetical protein
MQIHDDTSRNRGTVLRHPWPYMHPPKGTCVPGCQRYGLCHCGCARRPRVSQVTFAPEHRYADRPFVFVSGHHARVFRRLGAPWSKSGVPVESVRPLLAWLHTRHGTWDAVAELLGIPTSTIKGYANNRKRRSVPPEAARRIQRLVLAHRKRGTLLDRWETEPGFRRTGEG